jgi:hypothetical protein
MNVNDVSDQNVSSGSSEKCEPSMHQNGNLIEYGQKHADMRKHKGTEVWPKAWW